MGLRLEDKQAMVTQVQAVAQTAHSVVAANIVAHGIAVDGASREGAPGRRLHAGRQEHAGASRGHGYAVRVHRRHLKGPLILAFSQDDPGAAARVVKDFAKGNDKLVPTLVALGGQVYAAAHIDRVASLPTRAQALSMMLGVLMAPVSKFVRTLAEPAAKLVRTVDASQGDESRLTNEPLIRVNDTYLSGEMAMAASKEQILEAISNMTIMEVVDLVKMMEDKFGVTAAAPVAMAAARAAPPPRPRKRPSSPCAQGLPGREEGHRHQGDPRDHRSRPQGSQGPGGRRSVDRQGSRVEGGCREAQEAARRRWRYRSRSSNDLHARSPPRSPWHRTPARAGSRKGAGRAPVSMSGLFSYFDSQ